MKRNGIFSKLFLILVFAFLYAPILVLVAFSFNASQSSAVWGGFSLQWYAELFQDRYVLEALQTTLLVSLLSAAIATVAGTAAAIGFANMRRKARTACLTVNNIPLTNADIITGVSMMLLFVLALGAINGLFGGLGIRLRLGFGTLLIAHITFNIPYVILSVMPKLRQLDPNILEAAQDLGATGWYAFRKVILPEILPGVLNGALIAFTMSIDDFVIGGLLHGAPAHQPGDQRPVHPHVCGGHRPHDPHQCPAEPAGSAHPGGHPGRAAGRPAALIPIPVPAPPGHAPAGLENMYFVSERSTREN